MSGNYKCGGHNRTHGMYEAAPRIDSFWLASILRSLYKEQEPCGINLKWLQGDDKVYTRMKLVYDPDADQIHAVYSLNGESRQKLLPINQVANPYGGYKTYFLCPACGRRVRYLCFTGERIACRKCTHLNYAVQQCGRDDVLKRRTMNLLRTLEIDTSLMTVGEMMDTRIPEYIEKPRYMRWNRFYKLYFALMDTKIEYWHRQAHRLKSL